MTTLLPENMSGNLTKLLRFGQFCLALAATNFLLAAAGAGRSWMAGLAVTKMRRGQVPMSRT